MLSAEATNTNLIVFVLIWPKLEPNKQKQNKKLFKSFLIFQKYLNSSDGVLIIHRVTNTTVGLYRCIATNDAGSSQANIYLKVTYGNELGNSWNVWTGYTI